MYFQKHASAKMLFAEAEKRGLQPEWHGRDGLFSVRHDDRTVWVYYTKLHINSQLGAAICADKSLTRRVLEREGLPSIPWCYSRDKKEPHAFFDAHAPVIQKPVGGMKAENVKLVTKREDLDVSSPEDTLLEQFIDGIEYRCLVLKGEVIGMQCKTPDPKDGFPWRKRVANLGSPEEHDKAMTELSVRIADMLHMGLIAVDFIVDASGATRVLELNGMPGLHSFHHPDDGEAMDVASRVMDVMLS